MTLHLDNRCGWHEHGVQCCKPASHDDAHEFKPSSSLIDVIGYGATDGVHWVKTVDGVYYKWNEPYERKSDVMTMKLSLGALEDIAKAVRKLQDVGLDVTQLRVGEHMIWLQSTDDQREGRSYTIVGITDKVATKPDGFLPGHTPGYRGEVMKS